MVSSWLGRSQGRMCVLRLEGWTGILAAVSTVDRRTHRESQEAGGSKECLHEILTPIPVCVQGVSPHQATLQHQLGAPYSTPS